MFHRLRCRFDQAYMIKKGFGLNPIRNNRELRSLIKFCKEELEYPWSSLNPEQETVFKETIRRYNNKSYYLMDYIIEHCDYYWS